MARPCPRGARDAYSPVAKSVAVGNPGGRIDCRYSRENRTCAYCGKKDVPLQIEHIQPRVLGGSDRVSNLTVACLLCNEKKAAQPVEKFLANKPELLKKIKAQAKAPLRDAAAVNATRWALFNSLQTTGRPVATGSGGLTKFNRIRLEIPKTHALDAVCVGELNTVEDWQKPTLAIKATGRGSYQRTRLNAFGFPRGYLTRSKHIKGFQTGDILTCALVRGQVLMALCCSPASSQRTWSTNQARSIS
ncbi:hypothetical protein CCP3SC15_970002 [Gammaproteobacteria bacterium]